MVNANALAEEIRKAIRNVQGGGKLELHRPFISMEDVEHVTHAVRAEPVGYGYIEEFEEELKLQTGSPYAVAVSSGTAALHLALLALGVKPGDEVVVPPMEFAAAAAAVRYCGATPHFGAQANGQSAQIKVHLLGRPDISVNNAVQPATVIEDAAAALGSRSHQGMMCGTMAPIGILSFNNNKIVTTGGGGAVLTHSSTLAERVRHLATTARTPGSMVYRFDHDAVGYNYRMGNIAAALGLGQLLRLPAILRSKRKLFQEYELAFDGIDEVRLLQPDEGTKPNHWLNAITVPEEAFDVIMDALLEDEIQARALFTPLPDLPPYQNDPSEPDALKEARWQFRTTICIPSGAMS